MGRLKETLKFLAFRSPLGAALGPSYPYKLAPAQLAFLCDAISRTASVGGSILEIGVAKGDTSVFLLEHLKTTGDARSPVFIDTFSGFTEESIRHEVSRGKNAADIAPLFRHGSEQIFRRGLERCGYAKFSIVKGDAAKVDYAALAPISVVLLDIDVYLPTKCVLDAIWPLMTSPGFLMVDDCRPNETHLWDGSLQAYTEFIQAHGLPNEIIGGKGGAILKAAS